MGGSPTGYEGFEYGGGELIAEDNAEESATYEEQHVWKIVLAKDDKGNDKQKGDPYEHLRGIPGHTVQVERGTPVEKECDELVHEAKKNGMQDIKWRLTNDCRMDVSHSLGVFRVLHPVLWDRL